MSTARVGALRRLPRLRDSTASLPLGQQLRRCSFAVRKNLSDRRRKFIKARARHDDAVTAAVSFLGDTQESPAVIFPEFDVEILALNLQFSRLNDVVHFALRLRL